MPELILASTSKYRKNLLSRLRLPFRCEAPGCDETPLPDEAPAALARRLGFEKASAVAQHIPQALVLGGDQVAELDGEVLGKPGTSERACAQLAACSGRTVRFYTSMCLLGPDHWQWQHLAPYEVTFRSLNAREIENYVALDQPLDCAGSFKWESLGTSLFESMKGDDPTALEGLPLIALCRGLREAGIDPLASAQR